jgi:hypothetical protein
MFSAQFHLEILAQRIAQNAMRKSLAVAHAKCAIAVLCVATAVLSKETLFAEKTFSEQFHLVVETLSELLGES